MGLVANQTEADYSLVKLETGNRSWGEAANSDSAIWEVESKVSIRVTKWLRGGDRVAQVLDDVQNLSLLSDIYGFHLRLELYSTLLVISAVNICLG